MGHPMLPPGAFDRRVRTHGVTGVLRKVRNAPGATRGTATGKFRTSLHPRYHLTLALAQSNPHHLARSRGGSRPPRGVRHPSLPCAVSPIRSPPLAVHRRSALRSGLQARAWWATAKTVQIKKWSVKSTQDLKQLLAIPVRWGRLYDLPRRGLLQPGCQSQSCMHTAYTYTRASCLLPDRSACCSSEKWLKAESCCEAERSDSWVST
mmetsp:Transcript_9651/g.21860  ORF Transcript_9651/g.21860 Transcript_9651/m.21860 type:complete len:207 (+) Transcript_9651:388-1008(+)